MRLAIVALLVACVARAFVGGATDSGECSKLVSRKVRQFLERDVFSTLPFDAARLPISCPINPQRDIYNKFESSKVELNNADWKCTICGKRFVSEFYLDRHMDNKHADHLLSGNDTFKPICLAELCPIFGCKPQLSELPSEPKSAEGDHYHHFVPRSIFHRLERCTPEKLESIKQLCQDVASSCFVEGLKEQRAMFQHRVCDNLRCQRGVLEGGIRTTAPPMTTSVLYSILRYLVVFIILVVACFQASLSEQGFFAWFLAGRNKSADVLGNYDRRKKGAAAAAATGWWFKIKSMFRSSAARAHKIK